MCAAGRDKVIVRTAFACRNNDMSESAFKVIYVPMRLLADTRIWSDFSLLKDAPLIGISLSVLNLHLASYEMASSVCHCFQAKGRSLYCIFLLFALIYPFSSASTG